MFRSILSSPLLKSESFQILHSLQLKLIKNNKEQFVSIRVPNTGILQTGNQIQIVTDCQTPAPISTFLHPAASANLLTPLSPPSAFARVAALAFTYGKALGKPACDHLHVRCLSCSPQGCCNTRCHHPLLPLFSCCCGTTFHHNPTAAHCHQCRRDYKGLAWQTHSSVLAVVWESNNNMPVRYKSP